MNRDQWIEGHTKPTMGQHKCEKSRGSHSLLRLDSTGEVTSDQRCMTKRFFNCADKRKADSLKRSPNSDHSFKNLANNFGVSSIFDSASSYFETAATYLGSLNPKQLTSNSLTSEGSGKAGSIAYLKTVFSSSGNCETLKKGTDTVSTTMFDSSVTTMDHCPCNQLNNTRRLTASTIPTWSCTQLIGAILNNCSATCNKVNMKTPKVERYIPPQRRLGMEERAKATSAFIDPKLTPYNAKLLEKSKKHHTQNSKITSPCTRGSSEINSIVVPSDNQRSSETESVCNGKEDKLCEPAIDNDLECDGIESIPNIECETVYKGNEAEVKVDETIVHEPESLPDWFEYDCPDGNVTCIPIEIDAEKLNFSNKTCSVERQTSSGSQESISDQQQLHNWYSVEFDPDVRKSEGAKSVAKHSSQSEKILVKNSGKTQEEKLDSEERIDSLKKDKHTTCNPSVQCDKQVQNDCDISSVLFVRNCGKKSRPSKKKRCRQKAQVEEGKQSKTLKPGSAVHPKSPVSFMMGVNSKSSDSNVQSFQFEFCDIDSGSDWSDSEGDTDEDFSSLEEDELLGLRCTNILGGCDVFRVSCSIQTPTQSDCSSTIADVNQSWLLHISIRPEPSNKTPSTKKVHFADPDSIAEVHPIIAWRYAYAAARRGPWEQYARDRGRFQRRIREVESVLSPIFVQQHRDKVFTERFSEDSMCM